MVVPIFSRRTFDFSNLAALQEFAIVIVRAQPLIGYADAVMQLRVHGATIPTASSVTLRAQAIAPTCDEPETDFLGDIVGAIELEPGVKAPSLFGVTLAPDFGSHVQFALLATKDFGSMVVDLSADLVLRESPVEAALFRQFTVHAYTPSSTSIVYVPFVSNAAASAINDGTPSLRMIAQHDGWLDRAVVHTTTDAGNATLGLHLNNSGTALVSRTLGVNNHSATVFEFGPSARFTRGDLISLSLTPMTLPGSVNLQCEWVLRRGT